MLSGESASGKYPVEAAQTMAKIAQVSEMELNYKSMLNRNTEGHILNVANAISLATCTTASQLNASAIITATQSGHTARMVSKYRPACPIIAVTPSDVVARKLALNFGVYAILAEKVNSTDELIEKSVDISLKAGYIKKGDLVVIAAGIPVSYSGTTNMLKVHIVGDILVQGRGAGSKAVYGNAKIIRQFKDADEILEQNDILVIKNLGREYISLLDRVSGVIAEEGGFTSHLAIECISREIPLICSAGGAMDMLKSGSFVTMDTTRGIVYNGRTNIK